MGARVVSPAASRRNGWLARRSAEADGEQPVAPAGHAGEREIEVDLHRHRGGDHVHREEVDGAPDGVFDHPRSGMAVHELAGGCLHRAGQKKGRSFQAETTDGERAGVAGMAGDPCAPVASPGRAGDAPDMVLAPRFHRARDRRRWRRGATGIAWLRARRRLHARTRRREGAPERPPGKGCELRVPGVDRRPRRVMLRANGGFGSGSQRTIRHTACRARQVSGLCRRPSCTAQRFDGASRVRIGRP